MSFQQLGLRADLLRNVASRGYDTPTPIQRKAIPAVLERRDILAGAQTGTGKTAAFALPIIQILSEGDRERDRGHEHNRNRDRDRSRGHHKEKRRRRIRCLVVTPTRELAAQVEEFFRAYGNGLGLRSTVVFGGVGFHPQKQALHRGVDILVATPGRLLDHAGQGTVDLSGLEILVLDEADRMLDMGFIHDIRRILDIIPPRRQNLLFSATYANEIRDLAAGILRDPVPIDVAPRNTAAEKVDQAVYPVSKEEKRRLLSRLIQEGDWSQVLVFTRTKHGANRLAKQLEIDGVQSAAIHGNKSQTARTRALADFKSGRVRTLVATDIAARGLDIKELPHVVNYELPHVAEDYVHRIGRTGRAGLEGQAVSLVCREEYKLLKGIQRLLGRKLPRERLEGFPMEDIEAPLPPGSDSLSGRPMGGGGGHKNSRRNYGGGGGSRGGSSRGTGSGSRSRSRSQSRSRSGAA